MLEPGTNILGRTALISGGGLHEDHRSRKAMGLAMIHFGVAVQIALDAGMVNAY